MNLKKNKKSIAYFAFLPVFLIITYFILTFSMQGSSSDAINVIKSYNNELVGIDEFKQQQVIDSIYKNEILNRFQNIIQNSFSNLNYLTPKQLKLRTENKCKIDKLNLWYDERKIALKNDKCLPSISKTGIDTDLNSILQIETEKAFQIGLPNNIEILKDKNSNSFKTIIQTDLNSKNKIGDISNQVDIIEKQINLNEFSKLILIIREILPKFSNSNKKEIPKCLLVNKKGEKSNDEISCLEKNFINLIGGKNKDLIKKYDFKLSNIENSNIENFFSLNINIYEKNTKNKVLNFGIILKYNIPQNLISFNLNQFNEAENFINLKINKPKVNSKKIEGYIVLYSYNNFFSKSFKGFNDLKNILDNGEVPRKIKQVTFTRPENIDKLNLGIKYHLFENSNLDINLINLGNDNKYEKNPKTKKEEKSILIYQIYNYQTKKFEKLKPNKKIFIYVFAYDKSYSYYVDAINPNIIKSIELKSKNGPKPLVFNPSPTNFGDITNLDQSINIQIPKNTYDDNKFNYYDIYLLEGNSIELSKINYGCQNIVEFKCEYFSGLQYNLIKKDLDLILTSKTDLINYKNKMIINTQNIQLVNDKKYSILIIPVDKNNNGILKPIFLSYKITPKESDFYAIGRGEGLITPKILRDIVIKDNMAPNPQNSFTIDINTPIKIANGYFVLQWSPKNTPHLIENVKYLEAIVETYDLITGTILSSNPIQIQRDGIIIVKKVNVGKIIVKDIIPVDNFGNKEDRTTYDLTKTQTAIFNP